MQGRPPSTQEDSGGHRGCGPHPLLQGGSLPTTQREKVPCQVQAAPEWGRSQGSSWLPSPGAYSQSTPKGPPPSFLLLCKTPSRRTPKPAGANGHQHPMLPVCCQTLSGGWPVASDVAPTLTPSEGGGQAFSQNASGSRHSKGRRGRCGPEVSCHGKHRVCGPPWAPGLMVGPRQPGTHPLAHGLLGGPRPAPHSLQAQPGGALHMWAGGQPRSRGAPEEGMPPQLGCDSRRASQDPRRAVGAVSLQCPLSPATALGGSYLWERPALIGSPRVPKLLPC